MNCQLVQISSVKLDFSIAAIPYSITERAERFGMLRPFSFRSGTSRNAKLVGFLSAMRSNLRLIQS